MSTRRYGPYTVDTSNEDKVLFPARGSGPDVTKGELIDYYERIAQTILPHMHGRPVTMHRFPDGVERQGFYQKDVPDYFPDWIERRTLSKQDGRVTHVVCENAATLAYLANQACITPHVWLSRDDKPNQPDRLVIDLDPSDDDFEKVRRAATLVADALEARGLAVFLQLTGSRGIHVVSPIRRGPDFDEVRGLLRSIAADLAGEHPELLTVEHRKNKRGDRVFLDTGRNAYAQTMVTPYAVRARPGAPVATPIERDELDRRSLDPQQYTIRNVLKRIEKEGDPWSGMGRAARSVRERDKETERQRDEVLR